jgi:UDP-glucose 4-epimerase
MILVTGGCGYIGGHTMIELLSQQKNAVSIDDLRRTNRKQLQSLIELSQNNFINHEIDLNDLDGLRSFFKVNEVQTIIHFAAYKSVGESNQNPLIYYQNNINTLLNILICCEEFKVKNFIFSSSCTVYGKNDELPLTEDSKINEPFSVYGYTKQICENILKDFSKNSDMNIIILRYFNPIGAHKSGLIGDLSSDSLMNKICESLNNENSFIVYGNDYDTQDGTCIRDYIHITDLSLAHISSIDYCNSKSGLFEIFNIGLGNGVSVLEILNSFQKVNKIELKYVFGSRRDGDAEIVFANCDKSSSKLKWKSTLNIDDMVKSHYKYFIKASEL